MESTLVSQSILFSGHVSTSRESRIGMDLLTCLIIEDRALRGEQPCPDGPDVRQRLWPSTRSRPMACLLSTPP